MQTFLFQDPRVEDALGPPIKGYGEETNRRRRTHVSHAMYEKDGVMHMRMRFYIKGIRNKGIVELDMKKVLWYIGPSYKYYLTKEKKCSHLLSPRG